VWPGRRRSLALVAFLFCVASLAGLGARPAASEPAANFQAKPSRGGVPLTVQFTNTSNSGGGALVHFEWTFGDGQGSNEVNPVHVYTEAGKYTVTLAVTDDQGQREEKQEKDAIIVEPPGLVAAALPLSRSVQVGAPATAFVSVINVGAIPAVGVGIGIHESTAPGGVPGAPLAAALSFQTTDPSTNQLTGTAGTPVDIPAGGTQSFLVALTPTAEFPPTDVRFEIQGTNTSKADTIPGLNTLLLSASTAPVPDIVAVAIIRDGTPAVQVDGPSGAAFAVATANVGGIGGSITVSADTGATPLPLSLAVCQTDPLTGACATAIEPTIATTIAAGATATFAVFVTGTGTVLFDPEHHRIFVRFSEGAVVRGATSVAVKTL
jgi:hypothetical protein